MSDTKMILPIKEKFNLPDGVVYLDGNSLGPVPSGTMDILQDMVQTQWGDHLIEAWNKDHWMEQPARVGNLVARLIGAPEGSVAMGDTLSIKVYQALSAALKMRPDRKVILSDSGNFPSDLYMAQGLIQQLDQNYELRVVAPEEVKNAIDETVAVAMITQVDYRTGRMHVMMDITQKAHDAGAVMLWDLAHSAGAIPVDLAASKCEFAVGCTYKYLNGGPGAPAFIYARDDIGLEMQPALAGWLGHEAPFAFDADYRPAPGIERMRVGTPPVIQMTVFEHALSVWNNIDMASVRAASIELSELFIKEVEQRCPELELASPRNSAERGSQVSFKFENGFAAMQALIDRRVIGDFRAPDIMRFGFTPLYLDKADILRAVDVIEDVMNKKLWDKPQYHKKNLVT